MPQSDTGIQQDIEQSGDAVNIPQDDQQTGGDEPNMDMGQNDAVNMAQDTGMDQEQMPEQPDGGMPQDDMGDMGDDSTMSIFNRLSDKDKKAVRAYAESMIERDETQNNMYESFIFTKKQLDNIHEVLLTADDSEKDMIDKTNKKVNKKQTKSPFDSPFA